MLPPLARKRGDESRYAVAVVSGFLQFCKAAHTRGFVDLSWSDDADDYVLRAAEPQGR
ncbi:MAG: hypothetical protein ACH37Z_17670 [Anaerolineae bacterium]